MTPAILDIWVYLSAGPLLWLTATLIAYIAAFRLYQRSGFNPLLNPVAGAVILLVGMLWLTGTDYRTYFDGAQFVHFLLGPATVALAGSSWSGSDQPTSHTASASGTGIESAEGAA